MQACPTSARFQKPDITAAASLTSYVSLPFCSRRSLYQIWPLCWKYIEQKITLAVSKKIDSLSADAVGATCLACS